MADDGEFRSSNRLQHGQRGLFARSGAKDTSALSESDLSRLAVLRADLGTPEGIEAERRELTAGVLLIVEWGQAWLRHKAETDGPEAAFESPMMTRFFTAIAEARRALESLARMQGRGDGGLSADDVLSAIREGKA